MGVAKHMSAPDRPVVLDLDGAVGPLPGELRLPLPQWQEAVRFGCGLARLAALRDVLQSRLPARHGTVFMGSGDFHHLSWPLVARCIEAMGQAGGPLRVVVLDNHPDNMRFPWGVHCGSWVRRVALHPAVSHVHVAGITSGDIGLRHAWENYLTPLRRRKLTYWSCGVDTGWAARTGLGHSFRAFDQVQTLVDALVAELRSHPQPTYLSIDKDVFDPAVVRTNWDQGRMLETQAATVIDALAGQLVGSDVTGEVSAWRYATWWKRLLSHGDGQDTELARVPLADWQAGQHAFNLRLVARLAAAGA